MRSVLSIAALVLSLASLTSPAQAQDAPVPVEAFFQRAAIVKAELSPSGKKLAFTTALGQTRLSLVVLDLSTGEPLTRAGFDDSDVISFHWVNDERLVFTARDLLQLGRDLQIHNPGLFTVKTDGSRIKRLVRTEDHPDVNNGFAEDVLDFNHQLVSVPQMQAGVAPDEVVLASYDWDGPKTDTVAFLWINTRTTTLHDVKLGTKLPPYTVNWWFDSAGHPRAVYTEHEGEGAYYWQGPGETDWRLLTKAPALKMPFGVEAVDDAGNLFVSQSRGPAATAVLTRFDFAKMAPAEKALIDIPGFDFEGQVLPGKPGGPAIGVQLDADAETTVWFDPAMRAFQAEVDAKLPGRTNRVSCSHCGEPGMTALVLSYSDQDPGVYYVYQAETKKWLRVMAVQKEIDPQRMATVDFQRIKARDGRDLPVWLTLPQGVKPGSSAPVVVMVHGGPSARIGHWGWEPMNQFLASRGYLVIEPEFRGSEGYGSAHWRAGFRQWGQAMEDDLADALHWAEAQGLATQGKACIMGTSYGGYAALMGPVRSPKDYRCVIAASAVTDLELLVKGSVWVDDDTGKDDRKYYIPTQVGDADKDAAMIKANSPVLLATQMKAPVMLAWGDADRRVPIEHGKRMRDVLAAAGNPPEWVVYTDEGHGFLNPANQIDFAKRVEAFLAKNLH